MPPSGMLRRGRFSNFNVIETFYDGGCSLCKREIAVLKRLNRKTGSVVFTDISVPEFSAAGTKALQAGTTNADLMMRMHVVRLEDKKVFIGMDAMRLLYQHVGYLSWLGVLLGLPGVRSLADTTYDRWAIRRYKKRKECIANCKL